MVLAPIWLLAFRFPFIFGVVFIGFHHTLLATVKHFLKTLMKMSGCTVSDLAGTNVPNPCSSEGLILILLHKITDNTATAWPPKSNLNDISAITYIFTNTIDAGSST